MPVRYRTSIKKDGAFFRGDPVKKFQANKRSVMKAIAEAGEADVVGELKSGEGGRLPLGGGIQPGRVSGHVHGRVTSLAGKQWNATAVVSVNNRGFSKKQGIKLMAAASYLESQGHAFRRMKGRVVRAAKANADWLKGLQ